MIPFNSTCGVDTSFPFPHYSTLDHIRLDNTDWLSGFQFCVVILVLFQNDLLLAVMCFLTPHFVGAVSVNFILEIVTRNLLTHVRNFQNLLINYIYIFLLLNHGPFSFLFFVCLFVMVAIFISHIYLFILHYALGRWWDRHSCQR